MNHLPRASFSRCPHLLLASFACSVVACAPRPAPAPPRSASTAPREARLAAPRQDRVVSVAYGELVRRPPPAAPHQLQPPEAESLQAAAGELRFQEGRDPPGLLQPPLVPPAIADLPDESLAPEIASAATPNAAASLRLVEEGRVLLAQERYDEALNRFERSVSLDPSSFYGYYYLARLHHATKNYSQALAFANRAAALGAPAGRVWLARAFTLQGVIFEEVGRFAEARSAYQRAVTTDPKNLAAAVGRARLSPPAEPSVLDNEDPGR